MKDWRSEIVKAVIVRRRLEALDERQVFAYPLPEFAASENEIAAAERQLGFALDQQYGHFLRFANGWRGILQAIDLFGTRQLLGAPLMDVARDQLAAVYDEDFQRDVGCAIADVFPIGASLLRSDMFLLGLPGSQIPGEVVWLAGGEVDRFPCFDEFFLAMVDYNRLVVSDYEQGS